MCLDKLADFEVKQNWGWQFFRRDKYAGLRSFFQKQRRWEHNYPEKDTDYKKVIADIWVQDKKKVLYIESLASQYIPLDSMFG